MEHKVILLLLLVSFAFPVLLAIAEGESNILKLRGQTIIKKKIWVPQKPRARSRGQQLKMHLHLLFFKNSHHFLPSILISTVEHMAQDSFFVPCSFYSSASWEALERIITKDWSGAKCLALRYYQLLRKIYHTFYNPIIAFGIATSGERHK